MKCRVERYSCYHIHRVQFFKKQLSHIPLTIEPAHPKLGKVVYDYQRD